MLVVVLVLESTKGLYLWKFTDTILWVIYPASGSPKTAYYDFKVYFATFNWQISVHSVFSTYLDSLFFSILGWMADVRKGGGHVKIGENSVLIFQECRAFSNTLTWPSNTTPPPKKKKQNKTKQNKTTKKKTREILDEMIFARTFFRYLHVL